MEATRNFSNSDWKKKFKIRFEEESGVQIFIQGQPMSTIICFSGLDYGGLSRELFVLLSTELFNSRVRYFIRFNPDNQQALVCDKCIIC